MRALLVMGLGFISNISHGQTDTLPPDPGSLTIYTVQNMSFGAFSIGNTGGTVIISTSGTRTATGDVILLNLGTSYFQSVFDIDGPQGAIVSLINGPDITLTGSNGGTMSMHIGDSDPSSPFLITVAQPVRTRLNVGGTLTAGSPAANPPGTYTGTFYITFNLE